MLTMLESGPDIHTHHSYPPPGDPYRHQPPLHHSPQCSAPDNIIIIVFKYLPTSPSIILIPLCYPENPKADINSLCILDLVPSVCNKVTSQSEFNIFGSLILTTTDNRKVAVSKQLASN